MTPEQERAAWHRHNLEQLRQWRDLPFRQKLQCLEDMAELAATLKPLPVRPPREGEQRESSAAPSASAFSPRASRRNP